MASKDAALPASMDQSLHACRGEIGEPIREMAYSFVAAQPGHERGRMDVSMGVEIVDCEGSWKCKWERTSSYPCLIVDETLRLFVSRSR